MNLHKKFANEHLLALHYIYGLSLLCFSNNKLTSSLCLRYGRINLSDLIYLALLQGISTLREGSRRHVVFADIDDPARARSAMPSFVEDIKACEHRGLYRGVTSDDPDYTIVVSRARVAEEKKKRKREKR